MPWDLPSAYKKHVVVIGPLQYCMLLKWLKVRLLQFEWLNVGIIHSKTLGEEIREYNGATFCNDHQVLYPFHFQLHSVTLGKQIGKLRSGHY